MIDRRNARQMQPLRRFHAVCVNVIVVRTEGVQQAAELRPKPVGDRGEDKH